MSQLPGVRRGRGGKSALGLGVKLLLLSSSFFFSGARRGKGGESGFFGLRALRCDGVKVLDEHSAVYENVAHCQVG